MLYKDRTKPVKERVEDLLSRMTLEEKVGQMVQADGRNKPKKVIPKVKPGSMLQVLGKDADNVQKLSLKTRLKIPLILGIDAIHGHSFKSGATIFPTQIGLSSMWNTELLIKMGRITALEMSYTGVHWTFSPLLCIARDARWGRVGETFGEDPYLIGEFASAMIKGYQGKDLTDRRSILACAKHFAGYSETQGGQDASEADLSLRKLKSFFLPAFERAAKEGCASFMTAYQAIDGVPCSINKYLLTGLLKEEWGFKGIIVTDWNCVGRLEYEQKIYKTLEEASSAAAIAGNDLIMSTPAFYQAAINAVKAGMLDESVIDEACKRVLTLKFELGLFEDPRFSDEKRGKKVIGCAAHRNAALSCARESIVLLKNDKEALPLNKAKLKTIAVIGPNADDALAILGDWALGTGQASSGAHPRDTIVTVLDGIKAKAKKGCKVLYAKGCNILDDSTEMIGEAVTIAEKADVVVIVLGDQLPYYGEVKSTATLELMGAQKQLFEAIAKTGKPVVLVLINSKPLILTGIIDKCVAVLEAWNPAMLGGTAIAEVLFGEVNPSGKLTISFPRHAGQIPVYYNRIPGQHNKNYADLLQEPLFPFGFGLSYTTFSYGKLLVAKNKIKEGETVTASIEVKNTGKRKGVEIVQLYLNDKATTATWPRKILKAYARIVLNPGQKKVVKFALPYEQLAFVNAAAEWVVEPGDFELLAGPSSKDTDLKKASFRLG